MSDDVVKVPSRYGTGEWRLPAVNLGQALDWLFENEECVRFDAGQLDFKETVMQLKALTVRNLQLATENDQLKMQLRKASVVEGE